MSKTIYNCDALQGGAARALDSYAVASLADGYRAIVVMSGVVMVFIFDADNTDAETVAAHPYKIRPDDYSTEGVWIEQLPVDLLAALLTAQGDTPYASAANTVARLAIGSADAKKFVNAAGNAPEWAAGINLISGTRDLAAGSGDVAYTGVGFKPAGIVAIGVLNSSNCGSVGIAFGTNEKAMTIGVNAIAGALDSGSNLLVIYSASGANQTCIVKSMDADGFTLTWTKTNSPTGTAQLFFLCFR